MSSAGTWSFRAGNYGNPSQYFAATSALAAGNHVLTIMGFEGCCDGGQQVQFLAAGATACTSFAADDALAPVREVPEPASPGLTRRRKGAARKA